MIRQGNRCPDSVNGLLVGSGLLQMTRHPSDDMYVPVSKSALAIVSLYLLCAGFLHGRFAGGARAAMACNRCKI